MFYLNHGGSLCHPQLLVRKGNLAHELSRDVIKDSRLRESEALNDRGQLEGPPHGRAGEDGAINLLRQTMGSPKTSVSSSRANAPANSGDRSNPPGVRDVYRA